MSFSGAPGASLPAPSLSAALCPAPGRSPGLRLHFPFIIHRAGNLGSKRRSDPGGPERGSSGSSGTPGSPGAGNRGAGGEPGTGGALPRGLGCAGL